MDQSPPLALVVDDDPMLRMLTADILDDAGYLILEASHGDHAIEVLEQHHADVKLLFTDVQMPGGTRDGFALARETSTRWAHIAIVVASGQARPQAGDLPNGATFICKPFSVRVVRDHLSDMLSKQIQPDPLKK